MGGLTTTRLFAALALFMLLRAVYTPLTFAVDESSSGLTVFGAVSKEAQILALAAVLGAFAVRGPLAGQLGVLLRARGQEAPSATPEPDDDPAYAVRRAPAHIGPVHSDREVPDLKPGPLLLEAVGAATAIVGLVGLLFFAEYLGEWAIDPRYSVAELVGVESIYGLDGNTSLLLGLAGISIWLFAWVFESTRFA